MHSWRSDVLVGRPIGSRRIWQTAAAGHRTTGHFPWLRRAWVVRFSVLVLLAGLAVQGQATEDQSVLVVVGASGNDEFGQQFQQWAEQWKQAAAKAGATLTIIGQDSPSADSDKDQLREGLAALAKESQETLWIVLIGHGTFDGKVAKFNLRGPDVTAEELGQWLQEIQRPMAIINCASASAPFINRLSGENRVVVTATKSGFEYNFARFGKYLSGAIIDDKADLDKDQQISLLEAFLSASARVAEFYTQEARLATEEALLDDNGDALGTLASWFRGVRATRAAKEGAQPDGLRANQLHLLRNADEQRMPLEMRSRRDKLEMEIDRLRGVKGKIGEDDYYQMLEEVLVQLAQLYEDSEKSAEADEPDTKPTASDPAEPSADPDPSAASVE